MRAGSTAQAAGCLSLPSHVEGEPSGGLDLSSFGCTGSLCLYPPAAGAGADLAWSCLGTSLHVSKKAMRLVLVIARPAAWQQPAVEAGRLMDMSRILAGIM